MSTAFPASEILDRMERAVLKVRERLLRSTAALDAAGIPYAVVGGNAIASWVAKIDEAAVRNTQDVDLLIRRADFDAVKNALEPLGFQYRHSASVDMFLDGPDAKARDAVHIVFAGEKVRADYAEAAPDVEPYELSPYRVLALEALVKMKLTSNRDKDRAHIRDLMGVGLIDLSWPDRFSDVLAERLQGILASPEG